MQNKFEETSGILFPQINFLHGAGYAIDIGSTFNPTGLSAPSHVVDCVSLANDWYVVGDELRKAMNANE